MTAIVTSPSGVEEQHQNRRIHVSRKDGSLIIQGILPNYNEWYVMAVYAPGTWIKAKVDHKFTGV